MRDTPACESGGGSGLDGESELGSGNIRNSSSGASSSSGSGGNDSSKTTNNDNTVRKGRNQVVVMGVLPENKQVLSDSEDDMVAIPGLSSEGQQMHCKIVNAFTKAFAKQNVHFEKAIQSLDALNDQIIAFIFSPQAETLHLSPDLKNGAEAKHQDVVKVAITLMRRLLLDAQGKFRKMVEENKSLGGRLDGDLQSAHAQMALLRAELTDTNKRLSQFGTSPSTTPGHDTNTNVTNTAATCLKGGPVITTTTPISNGLPLHHNQHPDDNTKMISNGVQNNNCHSKSCESPDELSLSLSLDLDSLSEADMRKECEKIMEINKNLQKDIKDLRTTQESYESGHKVQELNTELQHAKAALSALKGDRKRLKAEKFELLNQMKQLYVTLEDKEKELRDFIRNYEQRMSETEAAMQRLVTERDEAERERWSILRHARDEAERGLALATQLNVRESQVHQIQEELHQAKRQLSQYGLYAEPDRSSISSITATYATVGDRGSSADSGVRVSSNRDSGGGLPHPGNLSDSPYEAISLDLCGDGSGDGDSMSVISTATLPQLFATPRDSPGPLNFNSQIKSMDTNETNSNALSRSTEQLLAAEAIEAARRKNGRRNNGTEITGRTSTGAKGAWGSISRVFARNKNRRALDPSIYEGLNAGQRSSWSPQSSVPPSPLTEQETYSDKLRALEEASTLPMELWRAGMVQAWIEVSLGMPQYGSRCGDNIKSGKVLLELSDADLESEMGISHPLHRKKLRLAIEEHRNPALVRFPCIVELSHIWVSSEWLPDIGLPQYVETFAGGLVDARLLDHLSKKDLEKYLGVTRKFHLAAIAHGVHLLRIVSYDRQSLAERRRQCENDPLVWTNHHFVQWVRSIDLGEYAENLKGSGVHGAFAVLEPSFNGDTLATSMGIPTSKQIIRRHLNVELDAILTPARATITQQCRVTKTHRVSTIEKHRSDSLGRSNAAALNNEIFRRSTEENRRRTSLRAYSHLFAQKGSLSRALGLKIKQDIFQEKERKYEENDVSYNLQEITHSSPPLPSNQPPGKYCQGHSYSHGLGGELWKFRATHSLNGDYSPPLTHGHPECMSAMISGSGSASASASSSQSTPSKNDVATPGPSSAMNLEANSKLTEKIPSHSQSQGSGSTSLIKEIEDQLTETMATATITASTSTAHSLSSKHRRGLSIGIIEKDHLPVHTPV